MPRPKNPDAPSAVARARASRERNGSKAVFLPATTLELLDAIQARDGDASRVATVTRLVREAADA